MCVAFIPISTFRFYSISLSKEYFYVPPYFYGYHSPFASKYFQIISKKMSR